VKASKNKESQQETNEETKEHCSPQGKEKKAYPYRMVCKPRERPRGKSEEKCG